MNKLWVEDSLCTGPAILWPESSCISFINEWDKRALDYNDLKPRGVGSAKEWLIIIIAGLRVDKNNLCIFENVQKCWFGQVL